MRLRFLALLVAALAFATAPALASNIDFAFGNCATITSALGSGGSCPGNLKTDQATYTVTVGAKTYSITATGYNSKTTTDNLFVKNDGPSENGLGLNGTSDNEINSGQYIYLDFSSLANQGVLGGTIGLGSVQPGEVGSICSTTAVGTPGTVCTNVVDSGSDQGSLGVTWTKADPFIDITVPTGKGNILVLSDLSVTATTPEPASMALFGTGLLALGLFFKRFRGANAEC